MLVFFLPQEILEKFNVKAKESTGAARKSVVVYDCKGTQRGVQPPGEAQLEAPPCRAALKLQGQLLLLGQAGPGPLQPWHPLPSPSAWTSLPGHSIVREKKERKSPADVLLLQTKERRLLQRAEKIPRDLWGGRGLVGFCHLRLVLLRPPRFAQTRCLPRPVARVKGRVVLPPHHISPAWYPNPAGQTMSLCLGAAQEAPLAVPRSAWCYQELIDSSSKA